MQTNRLSIQAGFAHMAYGIDLNTKVAYSSSLPSLAFDDHDLWFGLDFQHFVDNWLDDLLSDIETNISSVDSTNLSEQDSEQRSAQSSADRAAKIAAGLTPSETTSRPSE